MLTEGVGIEILQTNLHAVPPCWNAVDSTDRSFRNIRIVHNMLGTRSEGGEIRSLQPLDILRRCTHIPERANYGPETTSRWKALLGLPVRNAGVGAANINRDRRLLRPQSLSDLTQYDPKADHRCTPFSIFSRCTTLLAGCKLEKINISVNSSPSILTFTFQCWVM